MKRILFVDDHPIYRDGVKRALEAGVEDLEVVLASGVQDALGVLGADSGVDLCLADHRLTDGDGLTLITGLRKSHPSIAVGILCGEATPGLAADVRAIGGVACLPKDMRTEDLIAAINAIFEGDEAFPEFREPGGRPSKLSDRRRDVLIYASQGCPDKLIGEKLGISESTVRNHWHHIFKRLGVTNRTEAVTQALRQRLI